MIIFFSYIFYFIVASASPLWRRWLAKTKNAENNGQIAFAFQVMFVTALLSLFIPFFSPFYISGNNFYLLFLTVVAGIFGAGNVMCSYTAQKYVDAGVSSVIINIYTPITIVFSIIFFHEGLSFMQVIGTILLLVALVLVSKKHRIGKFSFDKYFLLMLLSGVLLACCLVAERALLLTTGFAAGMILTSWSYCIFSGIATLVTHNKSVYSIKDTLLTGGLNFFHNLSWFILLVVVGNLSLVSSVTTFKIVIMFIAGALLLNEREDLPRKIFGSIVAVVGLLLMG
jgi:drug/metabolite transporter (DMT)-like permease